MFHILNVFVLSCVLVTAEPITDKVSLLRNTSLRWRDDFKPELSWAPAQHQGANQCTYDVSIKDERHPNVSSPWSIFKIMEGGSLEFIITSHCNGTKSEAKLSVSYPEVKNFDCYSYSIQHGYCSWSPPDPVKDLRFFFQSEDNVIRWQECSSYNYTDGVRTGCDLQVPTKKFYHMLINGTLNNTLVRNTFKRSLTNKVRPPPLTWTVTKMAGKFNISWIPPDVLNSDSWSYKMNYTVCNKNTLEENIQRTSRALDVEPHCAFRVAIKACSELGSTPWSEEKHFEADRDPNAYVYAAVIIPLVIACLAIVVLACCRKNKEHIFPKVPAPMDLVTGISDNNNKSALYVPEEEEENCNISLVIDPQTSKLDC